MWEAIKRWLRCREGHEVVLTGRKSPLGSLVQLRCIRCRRLFCGNVEPIGNIRAGTMLPWSADFEEGMDPATTDASGGNIPTARTVKESC